MSAPPTEKNTLVVEYMDEDEEEVVRYRSLTSDRKRSNSRARASRPYVKKSLPSHLSSEKYSPSHGDRTRSKTEGTLRIRAKKFMVNKLIDSKLGRSKLLQSFGDDISEIFRFLQSVLIRFFGNENGLAIYKNGLKMMEKLHICVTELRSFSNSDSEMLEEPLHDLCFHLTRTLRALCVENTKSVADIEALRSGVKEVGSIWYSIMTHHSTDKTAERLKEFLEQINSVGLIEETLRSFREKPVAERENLFKRIENSLNKFEICIGDVDKWCIVPYCGLKCERPAGLFRGSEFCKYHHTKRYDAFLQKVRLEDFVKNGSYRRYVEDCVRKYVTTHENAVFLEGKLTLPVQFLMNYFELIVSLEDYANTFDWEQRAALSAHIMLHYIELLQPVNELLIPQGMFEAIRQRIVKAEESKTSGRDVVLPLTLYGELLEYSMDVFRTFFDEFFIVSVEYERFVVSVSLPKRRQADPHNAKQSHNAVVNAY